MSEPTRYCIRMATLELWKWRVRDPITGKLRTTRYRCTEEEARQRYPGGVERVPGSLEVREVGGEPNGTSDFLNRC